MMQLRQYQNEALSAIAEGWREFNRQLLVLPTGTGKTIVFANVTKAFADSGHHVLILAHRDELLQQAADKLSVACGVHSTLEKANHRAYELQDTFTPPNVVVGSVQTLKQNRLEKWREDYFDLMVIDEAHHCLSDSYNRILNYFDAKVLGVTATPDRGDKKTLSKVFQNIAYEYSMRTAIEEGNLCKITAKLLPTRIDLSDIRTVAGDYNVNDLVEKISPLLVDVSKQIAENIGTRKTLIFLPLINTSQKMTLLLQQHGISAAHVDGESKDRREILKDFESGKYQVLCNSSLLLEGYDCPEISCVVCLRPTKIRSLFCQMMGRGTRIHPNKENLLILDFLWQTAKHDLCVPASLFSKTKEENAALSEKLSFEKETDLLEAERDVIKEREESLLKQLKEKSQRQGKTINPILFALSIHAEDLSDYEPISDWEVAPASDKQLEFLSKSGFDPATITCKGYASKIIDRIMKRRDLKLATPKQVLLLQKYHIDASEMSFDAASKAIDTISKGWKK